jgi:hypothetical protein
VTFWEIKFKEIIAKISKQVSFILILVLVVLGFELRASHLLGLSVS